MPSGEYRETGAEVPWLGDARWLSSSNPTAQLRILETTPLPAGFVERMSRLHNGNEIAMLQTAPGEFGVYVLPGHNETWWKVTVDVTNGLSLTEGAGTGQDVDRNGACDTWFNVVMQVVGDGIPAEAGGPQAGHVTVKMLKPDATAGHTNIVYMVIGNVFAKTVFEPRT